MQLRADLGARRALSDENNADKPVDYVAGLGIQYSWGGSATRRVLDTDGDGVTDDLDKCPGTPAGTAVDSSGCPLPQDDDGDGVTNDIDKCPGTPAGAKVDASGCELDSDGDGVGDSRDQCPNTPAGAKVDEKGCELDSDGDGVVDSADKCPDTPKGDRVDAVGCSFKEEIKLPGVVFETGKADLKPESLPVLEGAIATLKRYPGPQHRGRRSHRQPRLGCLEPRPVGAARRHGAQVPAGRRRHQRGDLARLRRTPAGREQQHRRRPPAESPRRVARPELTRLSANDETLIRGLIQQAEKAQAAGQRDEAKRVLERAAQLAPEHPLVLNARAIDLLQVGRRGRRARIARARHATGGGQPVVVDESRHRVARARDA